MSEPTTDPMAELEAMRRVAEAVADLDEDAIARVIGWAGDRFGVQASERRRSQTKNAISPDSIEPPPEFNDLAELFAAVSPSSDADRALVVGYWFQFVEEEPDFGSQMINAALKNLGHGVKNITSAFATLMARRPQLVIQLRKAGTTQQARKKYKLTDEGRKTIERQLRSESGGAK